MNVCIGGKKFCPMREYGCNAYLSVGKINGWSSSPSSVSTLITFFCNRFAEHIEKCRFNEVMCSRCQVSVKRSEYKAHYHGMAISLF